MSETLDLHKALVAEAVEQALKLEREKIIKNLQLMDLICTSGDKFCQMCIKTNTNPWKRGCVMHTVRSVIEGNK